MRKQSIDSGKVHFHVESRLLEELGERLVSTPDVALSELVKNAYDADSEDCIIELKESKYLKVIDHGHGMSLHDFKTRWMTIATKEKLLEIISPKYLRLLTGAKGVGRFAARTLGSKLLLESVAFDEKLGVHALLRAEFDWKKIDKEDSLAKLEIPYTYTYPVEEETGTCLTIENLFESIDPAVIEAVRSNVLNLASPHNTLMPDELFWKDANTGAPRKKKSSVSKKAVIDPGFTIKIKDEDDQDAGPAEAVLNGYVGRAIIKLVDNELKIKVKFKNKTEIKRKFQYHNSIGSPVYIDIRFLPKRPGVMTGLGVDGRLARSWRQDNHGIAVYDKGFRVSPFGMGENDWLSLDIDNARKRRKWRSPLSDKKIPIPQQDRSVESRNPMVNIITNYQVIGCVSVQTKQDKSSDSIDSDGLIPSMDREGFVNNKSYQQLIDITRFAVEYLTYEDNKIKLENLEAASEELKKNLRLEIVEAIRSVEKSKTLNISDKKRIIDQYKRFEKNIDQYQEYERRNRENMDIMGFLGVLAGFMTHEHESILWELERVSATLKNINIDFDGKNDVITNINQSIKTITGYVQYTQLYVGALNRAVDTEVKCKPRIRHAISTLERFVVEREIDVGIECDNTELMPAIPIPMFEGVVLNLFTNALKALVNDKKIDNPSVLITCWTDKVNHYVTVSDNGIGIDEGLKNRIWDPLYTTTSGGNNPLGSGMGLGLPLVKRVIENISGYVEILDTPPPDYKTCFRVSIPRETIYGKN